ncbi:F-box protein At2g26160-like [Rosa rugosa]|uniref:F-box protein At2g26160-like n=1 Tax=Rosa rugosa TaxID=74645 RepID=UPI002B411E13|nr:F-box protein At2g26160-like [Rosa rugosa]
MAERHLPIELVENIGKRLNTKIDVSRFRSVCKSWRSSIPRFNKPSLFPIRIKSPHILYGFGNRSVHKVMTLFENPVYHLTPSTNSSNSGCWVIKVKEGDDDQLGKITHTLLDPISGPPFVKPVFPNPDLNLLDFRLSELAKAYNCLHLLNGESVCPCRVAMSLNPNCPVLVIIFDGQLYDYKLGGHIQKCNALEAMSSFNHDDQEDVICYDNEFYAVSRCGKTVEFDFSTRSVKHIIKSPPYPPVRTKGCRGFKENNNLVESSGELLLVRGLSTRFEVNNCLKTEVQFNVYKLKVVDRKWGKKKWLEKSWIMMEASDLNDRILFVGEDCRFSASTREFPGLAGNSIYFPYPDNENTNVIGLGVLNLNDGSHHLLPDSSPESADIFKPITQAKLAGLEL